MGVVEKLFQQNPALEQVFQTLDGQLFLAENYARLHQKTGEIKLISRSIPIVAPILDDLDLSSETDTLEPELLVPSPEEGAVKEVDTASDLKESIEKHKPLRSKG